MYQYIEVRLIHIIVHNKYIKDSHKSSLLSKINLVNIITIYQDILNNMTRCIIKNKNDTNSIVKYIKEILESDIKLQNNKYAHKWDVNEKFQFINSNILAIDGITYEKKEKLIDKIMKSFCEKNDINYITIQILILLHYMYLKNISISVLLKKLKFLTYFTIII